MGQKLGMCSLAPKYLYVGKGSWYEWSHDRQEPIMLKQLGLRAYIQGIDLAEQTYKGKVSSKLLIHMKTDDEDFIIKSGLTSWFSKTILLRLRSLDIETFKSPIVIGVQSGNEENVVFGVTRPKTKLPEDFDYSSMDETMMIDLATTVNDRIKQSLRN